MGVFYFVCLFGFVWFGWLVGWLVKNAAHFEPRFIGNRRFLYISIRRFCIPIDYGGVLFCLLVLFLFCLVGWLVGRMKGGVGGSGL
jgi:hypothetical protein